MNAGTRSPWALEMLGIIRAGMANRERNRQRALGPSSAGHPCDRRVALELIGADRCNDEPGWYAEQGTCVHAGFAEHLRSANDVEVPERFLIEHKVRMSDLLAGTCDFFDRLWRRVGDWKLCGEAKISKGRAAVKTGEGLAAFPLYEAQLHLYGLGLELAGESVESVAVIMLPRESGSLGNSVVLEAPYDRAFAEKALARVHAIWDRAMTLDIAHRPEAVRQIPATPHECGYCPFFRARPNGPWQCDGAKTTPRRLF